MCVHLKNLVFEKKRNKWSLVQGNVRKAPLYIQINLDEILKYRKKLDSIIEQYNANLKKIHINSQSYFSLFVSFASELKQI